MDTTTTAPTSLTSGLSHAGILTADLDRLTAFYAEVFDAPILEVPAPPGTRAAMVRLTETSALAVMQPIDVQPSAAPSEMLARGPIDHIAFDVPSARALEEVRRRLVARGASEGMLHDYGPLVCVPFEDPDGMQTEVCWLRDPTFAGAGHPTITPGPLVDLEPAATPGS